MSSRILENTYLIKAIQSIIFRKINDHKDIYM